MINTIIAILKIAGIVILTILGILLLLLLLVLFAPIGYKVSGAYSGDSWQVGYSINWLLFVVRIKQTLGSTKKEDICIRIFGIPIGKKKDKKVQKEIKKTAKKAAVQIEKDSQKDSQKAKETAVKEDTKEQVSHTTQTVVTDTDVKSGNNSNNGMNNEGTAKEKKPFFTGIKEKIQSIKDFTENIKNYKNIIADTIKNEENQEFVKLVLRELKKIIKHIMPKKCTVEGIFGFEDPSVTGQVYGVYAVINAYLALNFHVEPVFDRQVFDLKGCVKGRVTVCTLLLTAFRVYRNKVFRKLIKR